MGRGTYIPQPRDCGLVNGEWGEGHTYHGHVTVVWLMVNGGGTYIPQPRDCGLVNGEWGEGHTYHSHVTVVWLMVNGERDIHTTAT